MQINTMNCESCQTGAPPVSDEAAAELQKQIPEWHSVEVSDIKRLERTFTFSNFKKAMDFSCRVGELAEQNGHHPALLTEWGKVTVQWWTHKINGLHMNDFIMAAKTDQLL